ncbi:STAS domain-containing protein [Roseisolibacter agri]|uniref:Polyvinyl alcohol dehydrogenase n=1 Tax=Roseisolibacter agri TaxID=2014610 RepID=A0AA37QDE8_9BACT|nr:STAS domain-containing protein [Roseisolibacter agri]GLC23708.1 polyvinyl alcohol dehydrogenase [Roseisolibacter agri]
MTASRIAAILEQHDAQILSEWLREQASAGGRGAALIGEGERQAQSRELLEAIRQGLPAGVEAIDHAPAWAAARDFVAGISRSRAAQGFTPSETATFIFSLKRPLFDQLRTAHAGDAQALADDVWRISAMLDRLGLLSMEHFQRGREDVIQRQQADMLELSTPVVKLWDGILALPMIGTLDSHRTQIVMETLLQRIVETGAEIAIIDITGVPTVDTLTAQHLLKTVTAARLMGADCIISGIRPQIAQTIVHLGVDLQDVSTKASLADAFRVALDRSGLTIKRVAR